MSIAKKKDHTPQIQSEPKPPFPPQHQKGSGLEKKMTPRPLYEAKRYRAAGKLEGKVGLITGGDSGIGRAVAVLYAREGADVAVLYYSSDEDAKDTKRAVEQEGRRCLLFKGDVGDINFCRKSVDQLIEELGRLDIVVSNAAYQRRHDKIEELEDEDWDRTFRTNIYGYFYLVKACLPHLKPGASIIATSSINGLVGNKSLIDYSATKGAINAFTKSLSQNLIERGIRVNAVAPGPVWTPLNPADAGLSAEKVAEFGKNDPLERPAQPEEIAPAYVFFASDADSSYITGEVLSELGGRTTAA